jgi:hypothetical protein
MAQRYLRLREKGWRFGLFVNGLGAIATCLVAVIIAIVKFSGGAWVVMILVPAVVFILVRVNHTYEHEDALLEIAPDDERVDVEPAVHTALVLVDDVAEATLHAAQYGLTIRPTDVHAVHFGPDDAELAAAWAATGIRAPLEFDPCDDRNEGVAAYVRGLTRPGEQVTVILPAPADERLVARIRRARAWSSLSESLRHLPNVGVVVVRDHGGAGHPITQGRTQIGPRHRHIALILVERLDRAVLKSVRYARGINASSIRAVHAATDPDRARELTQQWLELGHLTGVPLDIEECHDRNIERSLRLYVSQLQGLDTEVTLILPRRHFRRKLHLLLHDRTSRKITRAFAHEPHVDVVVVPYELSRESSAAVSPMSEPGPATR